MTDIIVFGGTTEGREIVELLMEKRIPALACVTSGYGESLLPSGGTVRVYTGRLDENDMESLLSAERPRRVIDATHPYATAASDNIRSACQAQGVLCLRVSRPCVPEDGDCQRFDSMTALIAWLNVQPGMVFSTLGAKEAERLAHINGFAERVWLRVLPSPEGISACRAAGFPAKRIICMQGPFSEELNAAMFRAAEADILLTKESGGLGGYEEKLAAARKCKMTVAVLARPMERGGLPLEEIVRRIKEGTL